MKHLVQTLKWVLAVRGIVAISFGVAILLIPNLTLQLVILIFGITILVDGFVNSIGAIQSRSDVTDWRIYLLEGVFSILLGSITIFWPNISSGALLVIIALWAIITGTAKMVAAIGLRKLIEGELILLFSGILSVIFGFVMITFPQATALVFLAIIGFYHILLGIFLLSLAWRIKQEDEYVDDFLSPWLEEVDFDQDSYEGDDYKNIEVKEVSKPVKKTSVKKTVNKKPPVTKKTITKPKTAPKKTKK